METGCWVVMCSKELKDRLPAIVRGPTWVSVDNQPAPLPGSTDVCLMQFQFPGSVNVKSIQFKNYYTHTVCVKSKSSNACIDLAESDNTIHEHYVAGPEFSPGPLDGTPAHVKTPWDLGIKKRVLMPDPECEDGSQSHFSIQANESVTSWSNVSSFIFILRQPSKCWKTFSIQEVEILGTQNLPPPVQLHEIKEWGGCADGVDHQTDLETEPNADPDAISILVQRLLKAPSVTQSVSDIVQLFQHYQSLDL